VLKRYPARVAVIPFAIDASRWEATPATARRAAELRAAAGRPIVLFLGRLVAYKGVDVLMKAVAPLPVHLVIAGDGPMRSPWIRSAAAHHDRAIMEFPGALADEEVKAWMHAAEMLVLPSITSAEAFGVVQLEAMASGIPVISTSVASGVAWVNRHGETGLVVPPGDVQALQTAIATLLADAPLRAHLGAGGLTRARSEFTMPAMADRLVALCHSVAAEPR
jgi:glycosyltransferase involved in cell wall biosynthesis